MATATSAPTTDRVAEPGLAWTTVEIIDESRPTDEVLGSDGAVVLAAAPTRTIPTVVVYPGADGGGEDVAPADADPRPLAVWVNGPGGRAAAGDPLLLALYEAGYVVVAPNGPEVSAPVSAFGGYVNMPGDVSATIDSILDPSDGVADDLAALIDPDRIGVAGHSLGGAGAYAVGYHDCCRDERVSAVAGFAPPLASFGGGDFRFDAPLPLLVIHGTADALTTVEQVESVGRVAADALLVSIADADHFEPVYGNDRPEVVEATGRLLTTFFDVHVAGSAAAADIDAELGQASDLASVLEVADPES